MGSGSTEDALDAIFLQQFLHRFRKWPPGSVDAHPGTHTPQKMRPPSPSTNAKKVYIPGLSPMKNGKTHLCKLFFARPRNCLHTLSPVKNWENRVCKLFRAFFWARPRNRARLGARRSRHHFCARLRAGIPKMGTRGPGNSARPPKSSPKLRSGDPK